jgi:hypothetical protein
LKRIKRSETEKCSVANCKRAFYGNGLCNLHYQRVKNKVSLEAPIRYNRKNGETLIRDKNGNKKCINCNEFFPETAFAWHGGTKDKKQPYCSPCISIRRMYNHYGLTKQDIEAIINKQDGCGICKTKNPNGKNGWHVDHDHSCCPGVKTCGRCIRGVLCSFCNKALGQFNDSIENLKNAINYLEKSKYVN